MLTKYRGREVEYVVQMATEPEDCCIFDAWYVPSGIRLGDRQIERLRAQEAERIDREWLEFQWEQAEIAADLATGK